MKILKTIMIVAFMALTTTDTHADSHNDYLEETREFRHHGLVNADNELIHEDDNQDYLYEEMDRELYGLDSHDKEFGNSGAVGQEENYYEDGQENYQDENIEY